MWLAVVVCICTYVPLFVWCLRYLEDKHRKRIALRMLTWVAFFFFQLLVLRRVCRYPLVYSIMVIPKSVTRLIDLASHSNIPTAETMGFQIFYTLIGFVDVMVFFATRRGLLLFGNDELEE